MTRIHISTFASFMTLSRARLSPGPSVRQLPGCIPPVLHPKASLGFIARRTMAISLRTTPGVIAGKNSSQKACATSSMFEKKGPVLAPTSKHFCLSFLTRLSPGYCDHLKAEDERLNLRWCTETCGMETQEQSTTIPRWASSMILPASGRTMSVRNTTLLTVALQVVTSPQLTRCVDR